MSRARPRSVPEIQKDLVRRNMAGGTYRSYIFQIKPHAGEDTGVFVGRRTALVVRAYAPPPFFRLVLRRDFVRTRALEVLPLECG